MLEPTTHSADSTSPELDRETIVMSSDQLENFIKSIPGAHIVSIDNISSKEVSNTSSPLNTSTSTRNKCKSSSTNFSPRNNSFDNNRELPSTSVNVEHTVNLSPVVSEIASKLQIKSPMAKSKRQSSPVPQVTDRKITTLVFFDLETTGLGHEIGKSNVHITELSFIAMDRKEFEQSLHSDLRDIRIINKLSMCIRPRTIIAPGAAKVTGLNNDNLADQYPFDRNVASTVTSFLSHLPKPICLLAHNGHRFDFPLLRSEFRRLNIPLLQDILTADTLQATRKIGLPKMPSDHISKCLRNGKISHSLANLHVYFFKKKPFGSHSSEGDCIALAKVCHKLKEDFLPWVDENCSLLSEFEPMW